MKIKNFFSRLLGGNEMKVPFSAFNQMFGLGGYISSIGTDKESYIKEGYNDNDDIYSIVSMMANTIASKPIKLVKVLDDGTEEQVLNHPILDLIEEPNKMQTGMEFETEAISWFLTTGDIVAWVMSPEISLSKKPKREMHLFPVPEVQVKSSFPFMPPESYSFNTLNLEIPSEDIIHVKMPNLDWQNHEDKHKGGSPLRSARKLITRSNDSKTAASKLFQNLGIQGMITGDSGNGMNIDPAQIQRIQEEFEKKYTGSSKYAKILATSAALKWTSFGMTPKDLEIQGIELQDARKIANIYKTPSVLLNDTENSTYNNLPSARIAYAVYGWIPVANLYYEKLGKRLNEIIEPNVKYKLRLDTSKIEELLPDYAEQASKLDNVSFLTPNDSRKILRLEEIDEPIYNMLPIEAQATIQQESLMNALPQAPGEITEQDKAFLEKAAKMDELSLNSYKYLDKE